MYTTYRLWADELDNDFIEALKTLFKDKEIEIVVSEVDSLPSTAELDYTTRRKRFETTLNAINEASNEENAYAISNEELNSLIEKARKSSPA